MLSEKKLAHRIITPVRTKARHNFTRISAQDTVKILSYLSFGDYAEHIIRSLYIPVKREDEYEYNTRCESTPLAYEMRSRAWLQKVNWEKLGYTKPTLRRTS